MDYAVGPAWLSPPAGNPRQLAPEISDTFGAIDIAAIVRSPGLDPGGHRLRAGAQRIEKHVEYARAPTKLQLARIAFGNVQGRCTEQIGQRCRIGAADLLEPRAAHDLRRNEASWRRRGCHRWNRHCARRRLLAGRERAGVGRRYAGRDAGGKRQGGSECSESSKTQHHASASLLRCTICAALAAPKIGASRFRKGTNMIPAIAPPSRKRWDPERGAGSAGSWR